MIEYTLNFEQESRPIVEPDDPVSLPQGASSPCCTSIYLKRKSKKKPLTSRKSIDKPPPTTDDDENDAMVWERSVVPSDQSFVDAILDELDDQELIKYPQDYNIHSRRMSSEHPQTGDLQIINENQVFYRNQLVFSFKTICSCNGREMNGQLSSCNIRNSCLRIKYSNKDDSKSKNWEKYVVPLSKLVRKSAELRQRELLSVHDSPTSVRKF